MKKLMYLFVVVMLVIAGCAKDDTLFENPNNPELKKAKVPIPMKGEGWSDPVTESKFMIGGTGTHLGEINSEKSYYDFQTQELIEDDGLPYYALAGIGKLVGANGDSFEFTFSTRQYLDYTLVSKSDIIDGSGTGKFKGCSGSFNTVGGLDVTQVHLFVFTIEGKLVFK